MFRIRFVKLEFILCILFHILISCSFVDEDK
jgi:hypothetical protein